VRVWPCFLCTLIYFCSRGDMLAGTNKRQPVSSRPHRGFLHAYTRTHWDMSAFLHACMLACYPACCCHLLPLPATLAAAACFAKTRPEVAWVWRPSLVEILSNQTLAGLIALWSKNPLRFTRSKNLWSSAQGDSWGDAHQHLRLTCLELGVPYG